MKRFFKKSVALVLLSLVLGGFFVFHAQQVYADPLITPTQDTTDGEYYYIGNGYWQLLPVNSNNPHVSTAQMQETWGMTQAELDEATAFDTANAGNTASITADNFDLGTLFGQIVKGVTDATLDGMLLTLLGILTVIKLIVFGFLAITGSIFDGAISFSIIHIGTLFNGGQTLNIIWTMMRDFVNIFFIFIILYLAITIIIGSWGAKSKITIVNVILDAVLVNFSMFFTKILIDAGNIVAVVVYNQIKIIATAHNVSSLSGLFTDLFNLDAFLTSATSLTSHTNMLIVSILQILVIGVMVWVFLYGSFIIIGRSVMLILLTITSPIGFLFGSMPWITEHSKMWWKSLVDQLIVAPLFLFILYVVFKLMDSGNLKTLATSATSGATLTVGGYFYYIIIVVFLLQGMKLVTKYSGAVGEIATKIGGTLVAGAVAAGGGVLALGVGAFSKEAGAAATLAGKKGISTIGARLQFSGKEVLGGVQKFASGKLEKEQAGPLGMVTKFAREQVTAGTKGVTGGVLNIPEITKKFEEATKESQERLKQSIVGKDLEKANKKKESIDNIIKNIESEAKIKLATSQIGKDLFATGKDRSASLKKIDDIKDRLKNTPDNPKDPANVALRQSIETELDNEKERFSDFDILYQARKKIYDSSLDMFKEDVAEEKGINGYVKINPATNKPYTQKGPEIEYQKDNNGKNIIDPNTGKPKPIIDPATGQPKAVIDPKTGQPKIVDIIDPKTGKPKLVKDYAAALKDMASAQADVINQEIDKVNSRLSEAMKNGNFFNTTLVEDDRNKVYDELKGMTTNKDLSKKLEDIIRENKAGLRNKQPPAAAAAPNPPAPPTP
jgi:hypothetical protein